MPSGRNRQGAAAVARGGFCERASTVAKSGAKDSKETRLAAALRANLRRRKDQSRGRAEEGAGSGDPDPARDLEDENPHSSPPEAPSTEASSTEASSTGAT